MDLNFRLDRRLLFRLRIIHMPPTEKHEIYQIHPVPVRFPNIVTSALPLSIPIQTKQTQTSFSNNPTNYMTLYKELPHATQRPE